MHEPVMVLALIVLLGIAAQWLAWRLRLPSILLLLLVGILAGPIAGLIDPDALFGRELLMPIVALSVALILYEGGLTLHVRDVSSVQGVVLKLVTVGALVTWLLASAAAWLVLRLELPLAILLGSVLVVTGPTVIQPLLRHIRPTGPVGGILKWEGIVIDPIGALLALLVFEAILSAELAEVSVHTAISVGKTLVVGGVAGTVFGWGLVELLRRYWIPDYLGSSVSLAFALGAFSISNHFQEESGLLAVTWMGILLANQKRADVEEIVEFKENLRVLLISSLFILLAARLPREALFGIGGREALFVGVLVLVVRPVSVWVSTLGSGLGRHEKMFLAWMAPRGIVAAAVSSIFALRLEAEGVAGASEVATATFAVIIGSVLVYGLSAPIVARRLGLAEADPQGIVIVGVDRFTRALAAVLESKGFTVLLVDSNRDHTAAARMEGRRTHTGSVLGEHFLDEVDLGGIGRLFAMTPNDWVNVLAAQRLGKVFGSQHVYQLAADHPTSSEQDAHEHLSGRLLFDGTTGHEALVDWMEAGGEIKATPITEEFPYAAFLERRGDHVLPLLVIRSTGRIQVLTGDQPPAPVAGDTLLALCDVDDEKPGAD